MVETYYVLGIVAVVVIGLLLGKVLWAIWLAHVAHLERNPDCPNRDDVINRAKQVRIDVDDLVLRGPHGR